MSSTNLRPGTPAIAVAALPVDARATFITRTYVHLYGAIVGFTLFVLSTFLFARRVLVLTATGALPAAHCAAVAGYMALSYQINFTETTFLRSTSFDAVLLVTLVFVACRNHLPPAEAGSR